MKSFREFILNEADPLSGISSPAMGGGAGMPMGGGAPPMGGMGGPPMGGGMPPMGGGPGMGMGMGGGMDPSMGAGAYAPPEQVKFLNVWDILNKIVEGKPIKDKEEKPKNLAGPPSAGMVQNAQPQPTGLPPQQPAPTGMAPSGQMPQMPMA